MPDWVPMLFLQGTILSHMDHWDSKDGYPTLTFMLLVPLLNNGILVRPDMDYFLVAEGKWQTSSHGKVKFFTTEKWSRLFLSIIFKYHNGIWSIFSPCHLAGNIGGKSVWSWSKDDTEHSRVGNLSSAHDFLRLWDCYQYEHPGTGPANGWTIQH